ncbi:MAG: HipA family kinase, partial [Verrucomicrobiota bacterium]
MAVTIVSISGRAEKGVSRPFFCEGDDGFSYFVKSANVSGDQLVLEYLISRLAEECGLPVAPVQLVTIPEDLARYSLVERPD